MSIRRLLAVWKRKRWFKLIASNWCVFEKPRLGGLSVQFDNKFILPRGKGKINPGWFGILQFFALQTDEEDSVSFSFIKAIPYNSREEWRDEFTQNANCRFHRRYLRCFKKDAGSRRCKGIRQLLHDIVRYCFKCPFNVLTPCFLSRFSCLQPDKWLESDNRT